MPLVRLKEIEAVGSGEALEVSSDINWDENPTICPENGCLTDSILILPEQAVVGAFALDHDTHLAMAYVSSETVAPGACPAPAKPSGSKVPAVPGYEILGELGRGGMGVVYKARVIRLNRIVALKMILSGVYASSEVVKRFLAEAETIAKLRHPNIVQIYAIGDYEGTPYVELEYAEGGNLSARLDGKPWPPEESARLIEAVARAIHEAHNLGIVHRDLKPANLLLTSDGRPKITDFGLAKLLETNSGMTRTESVMGSPCYMAPEQAEGRSKDVGPMADVYALGANLYELLTGRPPFVAATVLATLDQVKNSDAVPPSRLVPGVARDLETICLKCLQKEPRYRYASALELADDLSRHLKNEPIHARRVPPLERLRKWVRRRPSNAALVVAVISAVAIIAAVAHRYRESLRWQDNLSRVRIARLRDQANRTLVLGRDAFKRSDWANAKSFLESSLELIRSEPQLGDMEPMLRAQLDESTLRAAEIEKRKVAEVKLETFRLLYDDVLFHHSRSATAHDVQEVAAARARARRALEQLDPTGASQPALEDPIFNADERAEIRSAKYALSLNLAAAVARTLPNERAPDQARAALEILNGAAPLGDLSIVYHVRRAEYLDVLGMTVEARLERAKADCWTAAQGGAFDEFVRGDDCLRKNNLARAADHFLQTLTLEPNHFWARYMLAICHLQARRPIDARADLVACEGQRPKFVWTYMLKAVAESEMGQFDLAEKDFDRAIQLSPSPDATYLLLLNRGMTRIRNGKQSEALDDLKSAIALNPHDSRADLGLAQFQLELGRIDEAARTVGLALAREPDRPALYRLRARIAQKRSDDVAGLADLERAARLSADDDPSLFDDHMTLGRIHDRAGRLVEAQTAYKLALQFRPADVETRMRLGAVLVARGRFDEAVRSYSACLDLGGGSPELFQARGSALAKLGADADAVIDLSLAIRSGRKSPHLRAQRGWSYLAIGAAKLALMDFEEASKQAPESGEARSGLALARVALNQPLAAIAETQRFLNRDPTDPALCTRAARVFWKVATALRADPRLAVGPFPKDPRHYEEAAIALVHRALDATPQPERDGLLRDLIQREPAFQTVFRTAKSDLRPGNP
jgi:eukaryotic-like serine/threonine-protein kinase